MIRNGLLLQVCPLPDPLRHRMWTQIIPDPILDEFLAIRFSVAPESRQSSGGALFSGQKHLVYPGVEFVANMVDNHLAQRARLEIGVGTG